jgi:hypothetical protein
MNDQASPDFKPYVPDEENLPELTWFPVVIGALLGIVFGASSIYLVLKVGLTVSASIPVAVLSITLFRGFSAMTGLRKTTILENNIVQTTGSAGESLAFGVGLIMPTLLLLGFELDVVRVMTVGVFGGLLGILLMIPLRQAFIVKQHGKLTFPESKACAEVLLAGEKGGSTALMVFLGFGLGFVYQVCWQALKGSRCVCLIFDRYGWQSRWTQGRNGQRRGIAFITRGWLHYRAQNRKHYGRGGRSCLPSDQPHDRILWRRADIATRARHHADQRNEAVRYPKQLHPVHRCRCRCDRRHHQHAQSVADHPECDCNELP